MLSHVYFPLYWLKKKEANLTWFWCILSWVFLLVTSTCTYFVKQSKVRRICSLWKMNDRLHSEWECRSCCNRDLSANNSVDKVTFGLTSSRCMLFHPVHVYKVKRTRGTHFLIPFSRRESSCQIFWTAFQLFPHKQNLTGWRGKKILMRERKKCVFNSAVVPKHRQLS